MFFRKRIEKQGEEQLDRLGRKMIEAASMPEEQLEAFAGNLSYAKVRARISSSRDRAAQLDLRGALLLCAKRAIPAIGALALLTLAWFGAARHGVSTPSLAVAITGAGGIGTQRVRTGGTCAISASDQCSVSTEDVLATLVKENPR